MTTPTGKPTIESGDKSIGNEAGGQGPSEVRQWTVLVRECNGDSWLLSSPQAIADWEGKDGYSLITVQEVRSEPSVEQEALHKLAVTAASVAGYLRSDGRTHRDLGAACGEDACILCLCEAALGFVLEDTEAEAKRAEAVLRAAAAVEEVEGDE